MSSGLRRGACSDSLVPCFSVRVLFSYAAPLFSRADSLSDLGERIPGFVCVRVGPLVGLIRERASSLGPIRSKSFCLPKKKKVRPKGFFGHSSRDFIFPLLKNKKMKFLYLRLLR